MVVAGILTGMLPLSHSHSFLVIMAAAVCMLVVFRKIKLWLLFLLVAFFVALPQFYWLKIGSLVKLSTFFGLMKSWLPEEPNLAALWWLNTGLFIPLSLYAFLNPRIGTVKLKKFVAPFLIFWGIGNFIRLAPWDWDNIKLLSFWYIFTAPLVVLTLEYLWRKNRFCRLVSGIVFVSLVLSGSLDNWRMLVKTNKWLVFDTPTVDTAEVIKTSTPPRSLFLQAPVLNNAVLLSGRQSFMGYPGRIWTHGIPYTDREQEVKDMFEASEVGKALLRERHVEYVIIGSGERSWANEQNIIINENFYLNFPKKVVSPEVTLYDVRKI